MTSIESLELRNIMRRKGRNAKIRNVTSVSLKMFARKVVWMPRVYKNIFYFRKISKIRWNWTVPLWDSQKIQ